MFKHILYGIYFLKLRRLTVRHEGFVLSLVYYSDLNSGAVVLDYSLRKVN